MRWVSAALLLATLGSECPTVAQEVDFLREVQPIFARRCAACHGPDEQEAGLNLTDAASPFAELESGGRAVVAADLEQSELWQRVSADDPDLRMPPEGKPLSADEQGVLRRWIEQGAPWKSHWAFRQPSRPDPPAVNNQAWVRNPIDAFVLARLEAAGLEPAPPADKLALFRRATYDLTGLPPTPAAVREYLADDSSDAYERMVLRLLESPQYGERWGRHWLDLVRYAESNSYERDNPKPHVWRYRDYVIRSFNDDKPYDQFVREQLAGDEIANRTPDSVTGTGYYRLGLWDDEPVDATQAYYDHLDDVVSTTGQVFLGLTINFARCHDHKIDPIPQRDYYRFMAFFHNILKNVSKGKFKDGAFTLNTTTTIATAEQIADRQRREQAKQHGIGEINAELAQLADKVFDTFTPPEKEDAADANVRQRMVKEKLAAVLSEDEQARWQELHQRRSELEKTQLPPLPEALCVQENGNRAPETFVLTRGNAHAPGDKVVPGFPEVLGVPDPELSAPAENAATSGRRTVLADWIASGDNPLTSRVIVNRVWQHHFNRGLVESANNFGLLGVPATHPELLDWLAREFVARSWRFKSLHHLIMTSNTYRMAAVASAESLVHDANNRLFSRQNMRRLSAEEVRDSMLAVSGQLNRQMFGPSIYTEIAPEVLRGQSRPGHGWGNSPPEQRTRRSIYIHVKRSLTPSLLAAFDSPETDVSCPVRFATTQPTQALALLNGAFAQQQAKVLAARVREDVGNQSADQVERVLWLVTQRPPTESQIVRGVYFLDEIQTQDGTTSTAALEMLCLLALNQNEFVFLD